MAFCSASDVSAYTPNLLNGQPNFSDSSVPTLTQVNSWLSSGCAIIVSRLSACGFSAPTSGTDAYNMLADLNALFGAARAELARTNVQISVDSRTRGQVFEAAFKKGLDDFLAMNLEELGLTSTYTQYGYVGGISQDDKDTVNDDSDRIPNRWSKGQWDNPDSAGDDDED